VVGRFEPGKKEICTSSTVQIYQSSVVKKKKRGKIRNERERKLQRQLWQTKMTREKGKTGRMNRTMALEADIISSVSERNIIFRSFNSRGPSMGVPCAIDPIVAA